ncbi:hypothetical protein HYH03_003274 [Edaphochlamys debaryana]|uniref:Uncharacterized protein n=1 Tax=Edaphochlamys debaryana TaxID=47281 RepID=A0A836C3H0_9CHLO|nr:hypothetical protein HYH03_003274 [Edaphochlamys debaryana]|eukprot:KAG2499091.1 hypothetical protein HYH03_003274 [Edaphochlamys debaryana]
MADTAKLDQAAAGAGAAATPTRGAQGKFRAVTPAGADADTPAGARVDTSSAAAAAGTSSLAGVTKEVQHASKAAQECAKSCSCLVKAAKKSHSTVLCLGCSLAVMRSEAVEVKKYSTDAADASAFATKLAAAAVAVVSTLPAPTPAELMTPLKETKQAAAAAKVSAAQVQDIASEVVEAVNRRVRAETAAPGEAKGEVEGKGKDESEDEVEGGGEAGRDDAGGYHVLEEGGAPKPLVRFKVGQKTVAVFVARTEEDCNAAKPLLGVRSLRQDPYTYLLARHEVSPGLDMAAVLRSVAAGEASMEEAVGPAVGCFSASFRTDEIAADIFEFEDPEDLRDCGVYESVELWTLDFSAETAKATWSPEDTRDIIVGLFYGMCKHAAENGMRCGFCVPHPGVLKCWQKHGVKLKQITTEPTLRLPQTHPHYNYFRACTLAYFDVAEVMAELEDKLVFVP